MARPTGTRPRVRPNASRQRHGGEAQYRRGPRGASPRDSKDAQTGVPPSREAQCAFKDSMIHKFCDSHYISRFAAFFIDARAKRSFVESFEACFGDRTRPSLKHKGGATGTPKHVLTSTGVEGSKRPEGHSIMIPPQVHLRRPCYDFYFL
jgi:hypothetical protein